MKNLDEGAKASKRYILIQLNETEAEDGFEVTISSEGIPKDQLAEVLRSSADSFTKE